ncbi:ISAs1 family transposase [Mycobacterium sp.]|uniref:ISAs1 family transposase n=1 Tax=Mycobacterium sp. TaxID=1785 RepID=UPI002BA5A424|nr:ISAs1 family transposase [Mycobacterium sp.]HTQ19357.1 ISAs1 family transposase [Mycobacterium sp.]
MSVVDDSDPLLGELADVPAAPDGLLELIAKVPDPRKPRGKRHGLAGVLAIALAATLAGARSFVAIAEWAADAAPGVLTLLGVTGTVPCESTIRRCLQRLAPDELDKLIGAWMWLRTTTIDGRRVIAFDGKTLRGARDGAGNLVHLLAGLCQTTGTVLTQIAVGAKTNEIPMLRTLLGSIDITGAVITADALHCQRDTAEAIVGAGGHYIFTVKANQPKLRKQLKELPWKQIPILDTSIEHGHGRTAKRILKATAIASGILFPLAAQVLRLTRTVTDHKTNNTHTEVVYAVTSLTITDATAAQVAGWLRGHWAIENKLHWVRDVTYAEDHSQVRTGNGPHVMAALRNAAIGLLRLDGHDNIAKALRHHARNPHRPVKLLLTR